VVTGEVAVTLAATGEGMVAGDAVNTAARVQAAAEPGQVLADAATQRLAGAGVGFADVGEHPLKGKAEPAQLWRATRVLAGVGGAQRIDGLEAPLTGRDAELRTVKELFHAAAERKVGRLVLISGPAGVGKSRLGWEFEKYIDGLVEDTWWHRGRCLSYGEGVAFWALAEIVRQRLGIAEEDPAEAAAAKLAAGLDRYVPDPGERGYVGVRLARLLGVGVAGDDGAALSREELFAGWRMFFERLAAKQPVILLVEDAQHADAGLLDFLDHLIDWARDLPIYVLVFARPELHDARPGFGTGHNRSTLTLDPLDPVSMDQLVDALVPGMPAAARVTITSQAQGIPLFALETVRSLIDRDIVRPVEGVYRLTDDVGELAVPDSLHALLAARLDVLDPGMRWLVADAAVLGTTFPAEALVAVSGQDEAAVRAGLAELARREVFTVSADPLSPEKGSYRFAQNMLRQVAYDTLSRRDRKSRHLKVAAHLRAAFAGDGEEVADVIASHYLDALHAVPGDPDAAQIRGQAITTLVRAAERAERTGAPARAVGSYAAAAELITTQDADGQPAAGALWERAAKAAATDGSWATGIKHAERARDYYHHRGQARAAARAQVVAGRALRLWGRHAEARDQLTAAVDVLRTDPDSDTVRAVGQLARLETDAGSPDADRLTTEALTLGQALEVADDLLAVLLQVRAVYLTLNGRRTEGAAYLRESVRLATDAGDSIQAGSALLNLAWTLSYTSPSAAAGRPRRRRPPETDWRPGLSCLRHLEPGGRAAGARRLGRCRQRAHPGRRLRRASGYGCGHMRSGLAGGAARRRRRCRDHAGGADGPARQRRPPGQGRGQHRGGLHRRRPRPARPRIGQGPRRARSRRRPWDKRAVCALGVVPGGTGRLGAPRHRRHQRTARPARRPPARAPCPDAAGRTRPGPRPPDRSTRGAGRRQRRVRRRDRRTAPALHPLPPGSWPA
jgi:predicted ATPase